MESFKECGWAAFAAMGAGGLATLVAAVALAVALMKPRLGVVVSFVALALAFGPAGLGFLGMIWGRQQTDAALASGAVDPDFTETLRETGYHDAGQCVSIGATISILPMVLAAIAMVLALVRKKNENPA